MEDCAKPELKLYLEKAEIRRFIWLYGDLRLMLKEDYKKKEDMKEIQDIMKKTGKKGLKSLEGVHRIFALLVMQNIWLASIPFKLQRLFGITE